MFTYREELTETEECWYEAECPICEEVYWELTDRIPDTFHVQGSEDVVENSEGCRHLVRIEEQVVTFWRYPLLFAILEGLKARSRRYRLLRRLRRLRRKLLK